jgi:uncharacterized damage-inducible protein DinB
MPEAILTSEQLLSHWQGHRALTRRTIEAFPEEHLFTYTIGGMRPFGKLVGEMLRMSVPTLEGIVTRTWQGEDREPAVTKEGVLAAWDDDTKRIDALWGQIPAGRLQEDDVAFGQWPGKTYWILMYVIDNEIHHRGQGYVYLRALGIEPPAFYER